THYEPIDWDEAFELVAEELNALGSPDEAAFYTSGRTSNEAAFLYQLFVHQFGTNNLPDCSNMCHESSGRALTETIGVGKRTVTLDDFRLAEAIFVIGQNPGTCHPRMLTSLQAAKRRGCKIVHVNPLPETGLKRFKHPQHPLDLLGPGTQLSDLFLQVRVNGDVPLLKGIMKEVLEEEARRPGEVLDREFIGETTHGFEEFARALDFEPPRRHGLDTVETIKAMYERRVRVFFALGGNFLSATPDTEFTAEALRRCLLTAHVSTKLNRAHLVTGEQALILPCLG